MKARRLSTRSWFRFGALAVAVALATSPVAALEMRPAEVQERYREVLRQLAAGDHQEALDRLYKLETRALSEFPSYNEIERFWRLKLKVIRELLQNGGPDQLLPIVVLHHDAVAMYRDRRQALLSNHSQTMARELVEHLASERDSRLFRQFAGSVLASFGASLQQSRSVSASADAFRRAIDLAPGITFAHLGLAAAHERHGEYEEAISVLEQLLRVDPRHDQGRLRLGVCQLRLERFDEAERNLAALLEEGPEPWVRSIAFQELSRLHQIRGERERAEAVLTRGVEELPGDQQLRLMLAALLDGRRRPAAARAVLAGLEADDTETRSARYLYDEWPSQGLAEVRMNLHEVMASRLPMLAGSLGAVAQEVSP